MAHVRRLVPEIVPIDIAVAVGRNDSAQLNGLLYDENDNTLTNI